MTAPTRRTVLHAGLAAAGLAALSAPASEAAARTPRLAAAPAALGSISGTIYGPNTVPDDANGYQVALLTADGELVSWGDVDDFGDYLIDGVDPGSYLVAFQWGLLGRVYEEAQFYRDRPESSGMAAATRVVVGDGQNVTGIDAHLRVGGRITGRLLDAAGRPMPGRMVTVVDPAFELTTRFAPTRADGTFEVLGLTTGTYVVRVHERDDLIGTALQAALYSGNVYTLPAAKRIPVRVGGTVNIGTLTYQSKVFADVAYSAPFGPDIAWAADNGITTGWADGSYRPLQPVSRDQMAAFLYRIAGSPDYTPPTRSPFRDITPRTAFYAQMCWLAAEGISTGWPDGTFRPLEPVRRDQLAAFLYRLAGASAPAPTRAPFRDVPVNRVFEREIAWLAGTKITTGWPDGTFRPLEVVRRDTMAAFLHRFYLQQPDTQVAGAAGSAHHRRSRAELTRHGRALPTQPR